MKTRIPPSLLEKLAESTREVSVKSHSRNGKWISQHIRKVKESPETLGAASSGAVVGGAAILLGNRGRKPVHSMSAAPVYTDTPEKLIQAAKPGDIVLLGRRDGMNPSRLFIGAGTGVSDVYHTAMVYAVDNGQIHLLDHTDGGHHRSILDNEGRVIYPKEIMSTYGKKYAGDGLVHNVSIFRAKDPKVAIEGFELYKRRVALFLRLRDKLVERGIPPNQARNYIGHSYSYAHLVKASYKELLAPIVRLPKEANPESVRKIATSALDQLEGNMDKIADAVADRHNKGLPVRQVIPDNVKSICTTAMTTSGIPMHGNKRPELSSPGDVWRSSNIQPIGHFRGGGGKVGKITGLVMRAAPHIIRGSVGAGLGVSGYFLAKKLTGSKNA